MASTFYPFPRLPAELRFKIWSHYITCTPPQVLTLYFRNADSQYLRLDRKACSDFYHIYALKPPHAPHILYVNRESRELGLKRYQLGFFDSPRLLSMGRGDQDVDTFTSCVHEVSRNDEDLAEGAGLWWDPEKDVVFLDAQSRYDLDDSHERHAGYIFGGSTGVRFPLMKRVAANWHTWHGYGIMGNVVKWEGLEEAWVLEDEPFRSEVRTPSPVPRWRWKMMDLSKEEYMGNLLKERGVKGGDGGLVKVSFFTSAAEAFDFAASELA